TRFLPQTKSMAKEMLPIIDKPVIQLVVEDLVSAGVTDIIIVTDSTKRSIEDHFDRSDELEEKLRAKGKSDKADAIKRVAELANFVYVRQKGSPVGNARPVINAKHLINHEPFFVFSADDFFTGKIPRAVQMLEAYNKTGGRPVICLTEILPNDADKYGVVAIKEDMGNGLLKLSGVIEKPGATKMPSKYASVMGYLLTPDILPIISQEKPNRSGEIVIVDSINELCQTQDVFGQVIDGTFRDSGDPIKYLRTVVAVTLESEKYGKDFEEYLRSLLC
ncbi:MAG TPA: sugar phosphate nucleotidyltransferase, partial [Candidatus Saccharimonadales bacterium]|nr:sugar phosphate nucleotidyltransferase [Candidatus Saccharimonadales bacterium]